MKNIPSVLFVCMGNICRSPSAEIIWKSKLLEKYSDEDFVCDSAGTISYHNGSAPDPRMQRALKAEGYRPFGISRKLNKNDFDKFDLILGMDHANMNDIRALARGNTEHEQKCHLFCAYTGVERVDEIPDPYYGGEHGFRNVIRILEEGCENLMNKFQL